MGAIIIPGADRRLLPGKSHTLLDPRWITVHTMVWDLASCEAYFRRAGNPYSHLGTGPDGELRQWQDLRYRAASCKDGNPYSISIENADAGPGYPKWSGSDVPAFTDDQADTLVVTLSWLCHRFNLPKAAIGSSCPHERGIGWHRLGVDPWRNTTCGLRWSSARGKVCLPTDITEVLTDRGWLPILDVQPDDRVASWSPDSDAVTFDTATAIEPFTAETVMVGDFESTPDHQWVVKDASADVWCSCGYRAPTPRGVGNHAAHGIRRGEDHQVIRSAGWKKLPAEALRRDYDIPNHVRQDAPGLPLSVDQVRLMAWFQADGHIMVEDRGSSPTTIGVEWHLAKQRKIDRLSALLDRLQINYSARERTDGTVAVRIYGDEAREKIVRLLPEKRLTWDLLSMSKEQVDAYWEEAVESDGASTEERKAVVFSTDRQSIDVLQALSVLNGRATTTWTTADGLHWLISRKTDRHLSAPETKRTTEVACLTTTGGTLVIRQHGKVIVTGNCPGDRRIHQLLHEIIPAVSSPAPAPQEDDMADYLAQIEAIYQTQWNRDLNPAETIHYVKMLRTKPEGPQFVVNEVARELKHPPVYA